MPIQHKTRVNGGIEIGSWVGKQHLNFAIDFGADVTGKFGANSAVEAVVFLAQTVGTVIAVGEPQGNVVRIMYEGVDLITADELEARIKELGTVDGVDLSAATVAPFVY